MDPFVNHTLTMLEDMGMSIHYPGIRHITYEEDGTSEVRMSDGINIGKHVNIEQSPKMKFMMIFTLLDFYIDSKYPNLEGMSFHRKYLELPSDKDDLLMIRELFRIAKIIRNSLVHNPSSFSASDTQLHVHYEYKKTKFELKITTQALHCFYTALVMYIKGDLGDGNYFLGIMRAIYHNLLSGLLSVSDEFGQHINKPQEGLQIKPYFREIIMNPKYRIENGQLTFLLVEEEHPKNLGNDIYLKYNNLDILVPIEALTSNYEISEKALITEWVHKSSFPPIKSI